MNNPSNCKKAKASEVVKALKDRAKKKIDRAVCCNKARLCQNQQTHGSAYSAHPRRKKAVSAFCVYFCVHQRFELHRLSGDDLRPT